MKRTKKKIAAAVCEYPADCGGDWCEISLDFVKGTAVGVRPAAWDTVRSNVFAKQTIFYVLQSDSVKDTKSIILAFDK